MPKNPLEVGRTLKSVLRGQQSMVNQEDMGIKLPPINTSFKVDEPWQLALRSENPDYPRIVRVSSENSILRISDSPKLSDFCELSSSKGANFLNFRGKRRYFFSSSVSN